MRYAIISLMLSMLKICMKCLDLKNKGEMGKRGQRYRLALTSPGCVMCSMMTIVNSTRTCIWK